MRPGHSVPGGAASLQRGVCSRCGKRVYATRKAARKAARDLHPGEALQAYRCGSIWHIGHRLGKRRARKW